MRWEWVFQRGSGKLHRAGTVTCFDQVADDTNKFVQIHQAVCLQFVHFFGVYVTIHRSMTKMSKRSKINVRFHGATHMPNILFVKSVILTLSNIRTQNISSKSNFV